MPKAPKAEKGPPTWTSPAYIAFCEAQAKRLRISYVDVERWSTAILNRTWKRDDPEIAQGPRMSASSGPKDYFINDVIALFETNPEIEQIAALILNGTLFLIVRVGSKWWDRSKPEPRLVKVEVLTK